MKLAVLQASAVPGQVGANLARIDAAARRAAAAGALLLVTRPDLYARWESAAVKTWPAGAPAPRPAGPGLPRGRSAAIAG
ncbi:hypothetical protein [Sorangium sp. So ce1335]|uniref:hypothetical protein n=1 Tax=Sorangium sp. So ce1335 TaxID=3133335 RepID=UPI003F5E3B90